MIQNIGLCGALKASLEPEEVRRNVHLLRATNELSRLKQNRKEIHDKPQNRSELGRVAGSCGGILKWEGTLQKFPNFN